MTGAQFEDNPWYPPAENRLPIDEINLNQSRAEAPITISAPEGGWNKNRVYVLFYRTTTTDGKPAANQAKFTNAAYVTGQELTSAIVREGEGTGTIDGVERASFDIHKVMSDASAELPAGTTFTVEATIDSPVDSFDEVKTYEVTPGEVTNGGTLLPAGTTVPLKEIDLPVIDVYTFSAPQFSTLDEGEGNIEISADGQTAVLTIAENTNAVVKLVNEVTTVPVVTPTPEAAPTPTTVIPTPAETETATPTETPTPTVTPTKTPDRNIPIIPIIPIPIPLPGIPGSSDGGNLPPPQPIVPAPQVVDIPTAELSHTDAVLGIQNPTDGKQPQLQGQPQPQLQGQQKQGVVPRTTRVLASTGANPEVALGLGTILAAIGAGLLIRSRRS